MSTTKCELTKNPCNLCQLYDFEKKYCKYQYFEPSYYTIQDLTLLIYLFTKKENEEFIVNLKIYHPEIDINQIYNEFDDTLIRQHISNELKELFNIKYEEKEKIENEDNNKDIDINKNNKEYNIDNNNNFIEQNYDKYEINEDEKLITIIKEILVKSNKLKLYDIQSEEFKKIKDILSMNTLGQIIIKFSEKGLERITKKDIDEVFSIDTYISIIKDFLYGKNKITKDDVINIINYVLKYKSYDNINHFPYTYELTDNDIIKILEAHSYIKDENIFKWTEERYNKYRLEKDMFKKLTISHNFLYMLRKFKPEVLINKSGIIKGFILYEILKEISSYMMSRIIFVDVDKKEYLKKFIENLLIEFYDYFITPYTIYVINREKLYKVKHYKDDEIEGIGVIQIDSNKIVDEIEKENIYDEKIIII